jgi:ArsR family transcriptional regulator
MATIEQISDELKAIADPTRLRILQMISECRGKDCGQMICVNALAKRLGITQSAVSQHLKILRQAGFVRSERRGYFIHYGLNPDQLENVCQQLQKIVSK